MTDIVYLLHYERPIGDSENPRGMAQHYLGYTNNLPERMKQHRAGNGNGSAITRAFAQQGIDFQLARTWLGDRKRERKIKNWKNHPKICPICKRNKS